MTKCLILFFLCFLAFEEVSHAQVYSSREGLQYGVGLVLEKSTIMLGEPTYMDFEVRNLSSVSIGIPSGGDYRNSIGRPESFDVSVVGVDGSPVAQRKLSGMSMGGLVGFLTCAPGKSAKIRLYLPHWVTFEKPGQYLIEVKTRLAVRKAATAHEYYEESGILVKAAGTVTVEPAEDARMGRVIDTIGKRLLSQDETAAKLVPYIRDIRIVDYLAKAVVKDATLIKCLVDFDDDRALDVILIRVDDRDSEVRRNVSTALSLSVHPRSKSYLLKMRSDTNVGVRLDVVHYLGKTKTAESTTILKEMVNDEDQKWIGAEARRYLKERGESIN